MANKIFLSQRSVRHVAKRLNLSYVYDASFGIWQTPKVDNTGLNFPWMIATDGTFIYVCDGNNQRIVKLTTALVWVGSLDISTEVGRPHAIVYDSGSSSLYVAGIHIYRTLSIAKIDTGTFTVSKYNNNVYAADTNDQPMGISKGFVAGTFLISGMVDLLKVTESGVFSSAVAQVIGGEAGSRFYGNLMHTDGNLYLIKKNNLGSFIEKVNSSYINVGDSDRISKSAIYVFEGLTGSFLVYDNYNRKVVRYDSNMNYVEDVYTDTGSTVQLDAEDICGIIEISI